MSEKEALVLLLYKIKNGMILSFEEESLAHKYGLPVDEYMLKIRTKAIDENDGSNLNQAKEQSSLEKAKVKSLSNNGKRFEPSAFFDGNGFSEVYMFGFLVLLFQTLFLIIGYMIFD